jgi:hypothetical protein
MLRALTRTILDRLRRRRRVLGQSISTGESGIVIQSVPESAKPIRREVPWHAISRIMVFKRDLYVHDLICMLIEVPGDGVLEVNEDMEGWKNLTSDLPRFLPSAMAPEAWFSKVAFPAFEVSPVMIYIRK